MSDWQKRLNVHWYDRNPRSSVKGYDAPTVAPHTVEVRWSYTVPKGKKAIIEGVYVKLIRRNVADPVGFASCHVDFLEKGGSANPPILKAMIVTNVAGDMDKDVLEGITMYEGDKISGVTQDLSTGGSIAYMTGCKITEFDADPPKAFVYVPDPTPQPDIQTSEPKRDPKM